MGGFSFGMSEQRFYLGNEQQFHPHSGLPPSRGQELCHQKETLSRASSEVVEDLGGGMVVASAAGEDGGHQIESGDSFLQGNGLMARMATTSEGAASRR